MKYRVRNMADRAVHKAGLLLSAFFDNRLVFTEKINHAMIQVSGGMYITGKESTVICYKR